MSEKKSNYLKRLKRTGYRRLFRLLYRIEKQKGAVRKKIAAQILQLLPYELRRLKVRKVVKRLIRYILDQIAGGRDIRIRIRDRDTAVLMEATGIKGPVKVRRFVRSALARAVEEVMAAEEVRQLQNLTYRAEQLRSVLYSMFRHGDVWHYAELELLTSILIRERIDELERRLEKYPRDVAEAVLEKAYVRKERVIARRTCSEEELAYYLDFLSLHAPTHFVDVYIELMGVIESRRRGTREYATVHVYGPTQARGAKLTDILDGTERVLMSLHGDYEVGCWVVKVYLP